ncbi:pilin [Candidatus Saccharibacteria bacterium]|nr:pilin [Candidatus Saccharibacteria bacterium]
MQLIKLALVVICSVFVFSTLLTPALSYAAKPADQINNGLNQAETGDATKSSTNRSSLQNTVGNLINAAIFIAGILAVIFIVYAGISYVVSAGDPAKIKTAQHILTYSIVGLLICILAFAIVNFVLSRL